MPDIKLTIPVTPPGTMGTTKGCHIYVEVPDQSTNPTARMDGVADMGGTFVMQDDWAPLDLGKMPYVAAEQPFVLSFGTALNSALSHNLRVYVSSYSDEIDTPIVRFGSVGATPSVVVTIAPSAPIKPNSGSNATPYLVTSISSSVASAVMVGGKLRRPISVTVVVPTPVPADWKYQLLGYVDGDLTSSPVLASGYFTDSGLVMAGPDGISDPHTFAPEEPTVITNITIYAVAGRIAGQRYIPGSHASPGDFIPNNIVPGITASTQVTIGTTTGVSDPTKFVNALLSSVFGTVGGLFDVNALSIDNARIALLAVDATKLAALAVTAAKLANSSVTAVAIANLAVGTAAINTLAITTALIANQAVGTAQIANLAVGDAQIANLSVTKLLAGTISVAVSLTSPTITVSGSGYTINLDSSNGLKISGNSTTTTITNATDSATGLPGGMKVLDTFSGWYTIQTPLSFTLVDNSGVARANLNQAGTGGNLIISHSSGRQVNIQVSSTSRILVDGTQVISTRFGTTPVTLADVISVLQHHGLSN